MSNAAETPANRRQSCPANDAANETVVARDGALSNVFVFVLSMRSLNLDWSRSSPARSRHSLVSTFGAGFPSRFCCLTEGHEYSGYGGTIFVAEEILFQSLHVEFGFFCRFAYVVGMVCVAPGFREPMRIIVPTLEGEGEHGVRTQMF